MASSVEDCRFITAYAQDPQNVRDPIRALSILWDTDPQPMSAGDICMKFHPDAKNELRSGTSDAILYAVLDALGPSSGDGISVHCQKREIEKFETVDEDKDKDNADDDIDSAEPEAGADTTADEAPARVKRNKRRPFKSAERVDPADDETDEEKHKEFLAKEKELREMNRKRFEGIAHGEMMDAGGVKSKVKGKGKEKGNAAGASDVKKKATDDGDKSKMALVILVIVKFSSQVQHDLFVSKNSKEALDEKIRSACLFSSAEARLESTYNIVDIKQFFAYHDKVKEAAAVHQRAFGFARLKSESP